MLKPSGNRAIKLGFFSMGVRVYPRAVSISTPWITEQLFCCKNLSSAELLYVREGFIECCQKLFGYVFGFEFVFYGGRRGN
jgi:hypothetical protein